MSGLVASTFDGFVGFRHDGEPVRLGFAGSPGHRGRSDRANVDRIDRWSDVVIATVERHRSAG